jgi:hypothetical protein
MIVTLKPQVIDAQNRIESIVYIKALNQRENTANKTVEFDVETRALVTTTHEEDRAQLNETGGFVMDAEGRLLMKRVTVEKTTLELVRKQVASFKADTFYSKIGKLSPDEYDQAFIKQLEYLNSLPDNGPFHKKKYFWNLTAKDVKVISEDDVKKLVTTKVIENDK